MTGAAALVALALLAGSGRARAAEPSWYDNGIGWEKNRRGGFDFEFGPISFCVSNCSGPSAAAPPLGGPSRPALTPQQRRLVDQAKRALAQAQDAESRALRELAHTSSAASPRIAAAPRPAAAPAARPAPGPAGGTGPAPRPGTAAARPERRPAPPEEPYAPPPGPGAARAWTAEQDAPHAPLRAARDLPPRAPSNASIAAAARAASDPDVKSASRALEFDPRSVPALLARARAYRRLGETRAAALDAARAVGLDPGNARAWREQAWAEARNGHLEVALALVDRAIKLDPDDADGYALRAFIRDRLGDRPGALADLELAARLDPRYEEALALAREGGEIFDPFDESTLRAAPARRLPRAPLKTLAVAAAGLALLVGLWMWRAGRRSASFFGKYKLVRPIGRGGKGEVFEAVDLTLARRVAVRALPPGLAEQARAAAAVRHPSLAEVYELAAEGRDLYMVFELVEGRSLAEVLRERGELPRGDCFSILRPLCEALEFAHARGVFHGGVSPANVMITAHGRVKLMDLGLRRERGEDATARSEDVRALAELAGAMLGEPPVPARTPRELLDALRPRVT